MFMTHEMHDLPVLYSSQPIIMQGIIVITVLVPYYIVHNDGLPSKIDISCMLLCI